MYVNPICGKLLGVILKVSGEKRHCGGASKILPLDLRRKFRDALHKPFAGKAVQAVEPRGFGGVGGKRERLLDNHYRRARAFQNDLLEVGCIQLLLRRQRIVRIVANFSFGFIKQQVAQGLSGIVHGIFAVRVAVVEFVQKVVRHLRALLAALAALAVVIVAVFPQRRDESIDEFSDIRLLLSYKPFVIVKAVAALHIHRRHVGDCLVRIVRALDAEHGGGLMLERV